ncbi:rhodanese-like domain-containing protein [Halorubrum sp. 48-1-W]|uniref:rhodanese-like domain-containing protein n=1 Tax=Halorubrum sp. 48-1-W TaxID=2249761 RepID=UPI000DCAE48D|nr:rhodanese-like domain-containing protein [Halorubrum sp. 48-1-W]RAW45498.1 rhodanese-like domain-containing protein [Halorubrum sp. 48-1-W]
MDGEIDPAGLAALLDEGEDVRIVDIRDERAFTRGHVPDSESIPFPELTARVAELEGSDRIVTVCPHGIASRQAAQLIGSYEGTANARVESLRGGIEAWQEGGHELETTADEDGDGSDEGDEGPDAPF